jgi:AraC family transcriptional regulator
MFGSRPIRNFAGTDICAIRPHFRGGSDPTGLSPSHFARQFRVTIGKAPHQYLRQLRIERAMLLLRETDTGVVEVAFACGFANQEHMTRLFKQHCGTTPAAYRNTLRA